MMLQKYPAAGCISHKNPDKMRSAAEPFGPRLIMKKFICMCNDNITFCHVFKLFLL